MATQHTDRSSNERAYVPGDWIFTEGKPAVALEAPHVIVLYEDGKIERRPLHCTCRIDEQPKITVEQIERARALLKPPRGPIVELHKGWAYIGEKIYVEADRPPSETPAPLTLTGYQIEQLADFVDGERDTELTLAHFPKRPPDADGNEMPAGLYAWFSEYPDEGSLHLAEQPESAEKAPSEPQIGGER
jgi:hypothetical protein